MCYMKSFLFSESAVSSKSPTSPDFMDIPHFAIKWYPTFYPSFCPSLDCFQLLFKQLLKYLLKVFESLGLVAFRVMSARSCRITDRKSTHA